MPCSGDFVTRRLPSGFVNIWDRFVAMHIVPLLSKNLEWPANGLRFLVGPDQAGPNAFAGLIVPSCDTIGRVFPLTIADTITFSADPAPIAAWFAEVTGPALDAAEGIIDVGELDLALEGCASPQLRPTTLSPLLLTLPGSSPIETHLADPAAALAALFGEKVAGG